MKLGFLKISLATAAKCAVLMLFALLVSHYSGRVEKAEAQQSSGSLSGYAWSDNIGWISLSGTNYGLSVATNNTISGYAWSDNIGWISANESGCPSNPCTPRLNGGAMTGWLKALAGGTAESGGWDGWISLSGSGYGVTQSGSAFSGYAWGGDIVGWTDFSLVTISSCTNGANNPPACNQCQSGLAYVGGACTTCSNGGCTGAGGSADNPLGSLVCTNGANNPPACNQCPDGLAYQGGACVACGGNPAPTGCTGPGGSASNPLGSLVCKNGANNPINCNAFPPARPTATLSAAPSTIDVGQSSTLSWNSNNATSCTGTGFTAGGPSGSRSVGPLSPADTYNYQVICSGAGGDSSPAFASVTVLAPNASISADPTRVQTGANSNITWSASQVNSCTVSGPGLSSSSLSGTRSVQIDLQSTFTINCTTNGAPVSDSVTVNVLPIFQGF